MSDIEDPLDELKHMGKIENKQTKKGLNAFFLVSGQSNIDSSDSQDTAHYEPLKDQERDITVDILEENPKTKDAKAPIKPDKIDEFTAHQVAMKAFFMHEVFKLKNENTY